MNLPPPIRNVRACALCALHCHYIRCTMIDSSNNCFNQIVLHIATKQFFRIVFYYVIIVVDPFAPIYYCIINLMITNDRITA